jgi:hypothetical protein
MSLTAPVDRLTLRNQPCVPPRMESAAYRALPSGVMSAPSRTLPAWKGASSVWLATSYRSTVPVAVVTYSRLRVGS